MDLTVYLENYLTTVILKWLLLYLEKKLNSQEFGFCSATFTQHFMTDTQTVDLQQDISSLGQLRLVI